MALVYNDRVIHGCSWCAECDRPTDECWCDLPSEAEEIAAGIIKTVCRKPTSIAEAELLTTHYYGTPAEFGHQMHANVVEALLS